MPPKTIKRKIIRKPLVRQKRRNGRAVQNVASVTNSLARMPMMNRMPSSVGSDFIQCRLNPWENSSGMGIPDASNARRICIDHRTYCDIIIGSTGGFIAKTLPSVGLPLVVKPGAAGNMTVNGTAVAFGADGSNLTSNWYPACINSEWATFIAGNATVATTTVDPFNSARYRIVTQAFKVYYTGPINTCSGIMTISSDPIQVDPSNRPNIGTLNTITYTNGTAGAGNTATLTVMSNRLSCYTSNTALATNSIMARPEAGASILVPHVLNDYPWLPAYDYTVAYESSSSLGNTFVAQQILPGGYAFGVIPPIDTNWESVTIVCAGATATTSFRIECITCVEYEPQLASTFIKLAKEPPIDVAAVKVADAVAREMPLVQPIASSAQSYVRKAVALLGKMAMPVGSAFGPTGVAVGTAVSSLANMLA